MELKKPAVNFLKKPLFKIISLFAISVFSFISYLIEYEKLSYQSMRILGPTYIRITFIIIPVLFFLWLFFICKVKYSIKNVLLTLLSYVIWFLLSYDLILSLTAFLNVAFAGIYSKFLFFIFSLFNTSHDIKYLIWYCCFITAGFLLIYFLFIFENLFLKKLFNFEYKKIDYVLLYLYPVAIFIFTLIAYVILIAISGIRTALDIKDFFNILGYLYTGSVIFGYMMTQGLFFVKLTYKKQS